MTNDEPQNIPMSIDKSDFIYNLPYNLTNWGIFYNGFNECSQAQIQKALLKFHNLIHKFHETQSTNHYEIVKFIQKMFYKTELYNDEYRTPEILLRINKDKKWDLETTQKQRKICIAVYKQFIKRYMTEYEEVKQFYEYTKQQLEAVQKTNHKINANEKICCPICSQMVARTNFSRHKKTNKLCISMTNDEP